MKTFECEDGNIVWLCVNGDKETPLASLPSPGDEKASGELARRMLQTFSRTERTSGVTSFMVDPSSNVTAVKLLTDSNVFDRLRGKEIVTEDEVSAVLGQG